jgi:ribonucleoside-diphosphate reductase alpha chain
MGPQGDRIAAQVRRTGSIRDIAEVPETLRQRFPIALEIEPQAHLRMQAAFQQHLDAAVSKTVNLPREASAAQVRDVFLTAQRLNLKGVTVYRYHSRPDQTLSLVEEDRIPDCRECAV